MRSVEATDYIHRGDYILLRQELPFDDPESWQSLWIKKHGDIKGFPWGGLYGKEAVEVEKEYLHKTEIKAMGMPYCPHVMATFYSSQIEIQCLRKRRIYHESHRNNRH